MLDVALKLLKEITSKSYKAYIVGGFVRDYVLGIESNDIDIATNATPKQIKEIFEDSCLPNEDYGSVTVIMKGIRFDITTFREEIEYVNNRRPAEVKYINDLYSDLIRRDFTINALCMDDDGNVLDYLNGKDDINSKIVKTIGDPFERFSEDSLRILRAVRFATILNFQLDDETKKAILKTKGLLKNLSYYRKKEELDKIFTNSNYKKGVKLLLELGLDKELEIHNLDKILKVDTVSLIGIWCILGVDSKYPFSKSELELISKVNEALLMNNTDAFTLYSYGLYVNSVAAEIKGQDIRVITEAYNDLVIKTRKELNITSEQIMSLLEKGPGKYLKEILVDIEKEVLYKRVQNDYEALASYVVNKYKRIWGVL